MKETDLKIKAKELVDKMYMSEITIFMSWNMAKQCALIACDEIINALRKDLPEIGLGKGFWHDVKTEIENL